MWLLLALACSDSSAPDQTMETADKTEVAATEQQAVLVDRDDIVQGLVGAPGREKVLANCTACHSTKLITQNRMTRQRWDQTITWMQQTQKLWPLDTETRAAILDYLEATQGVESPGNADSPWHTPMYPANPVTW